MSKKIDEYATCPYCGDRGCHIFYFDIDSLHCNKCGKEFAIKLETSIVVKSAKIYDKQCIACDKYFMECEIIDGKCPECGCEIFDENNYKFSEFDL